MQFIKLIEFGDNTIMVSERDNFFDSDFAFTTDDGLMLAFGLTAYDDNYDMIDEPDYGELKAYYKTWGLDESDGFVEFNEIPTTQCTYEQLGIYPNGT